jgi:alkylation response protein AidB-like acyl-CoA dehydrogenase
MIDRALSDEQQMLGESVERMLKSCYTFDERRRILQRGDGCDAQRWQTFAQLGLLGMPFSPDHGGSGAGAIETMVVMKAFGRHLVVEPYLPTVVLAGAALRHAGSAELRQRLIPPIVAGHTRLAFAHSEPQSRYHLAHVATTAVRQGAYWELDGHKSVVLGAGQADHLIVSARTSGDTLSPNGISLFMVERRTPGLTVTDYPCVDGTRAAELVFQQVRIPQDSYLGEIDRALPVIEQVMDEACAALCAEATGAMLALNEKTLEYTQTRTAFGQAVASFQVIQHRLVDMRVACEYAQAMALMAAQAAIGPAERRQRAVSAAKFMIGRDSKFVAQNAIQLHGAIGITDELDISHYFKRITAIGVLLGSPDHHLRRFWNLWRGNSAVTRATGCAASGAEA